MMARPVHAPSSSIRALPWAPCGALLIALQAGCGGEAAPPGGTPTVVADGAVDTLVTTASGVLGWARGLAVGDDGMLYVSDAQNHVIHRITPAGDRLPALGREGEGPGELNQPGALAVSGDTLTVVDVRNARFQQMRTADGTTLSTRTAARPAGYGAVPAGDGWAAFPTAGLDTMLVALLGPEGEAVGLGRIEGEPSNFVRMGEVKERIAAGEVPAFLLNQATAAFAADGDVLVGVPARAQVARHSRDGAEVWSLTLDEPGFERIRASFVEENARAEPNRLVSLRYFDDLAAVGDETWLLIGGAADAARIVAVGQDGRMVRRIEVPGVSGARAIAADPARRALYLSIPDLSELLRVTLPEEAFAR